MPKFYYQIKGREFCDISNAHQWAWPPVFSGLVNADDRKIAKAMIEEEYSRKFPMRVLLKDIEQHAFLLHITEIKAENYYLNRRFEETECLECGVKFKPIDKYNDPHCDNKSLEFCSDKCHQAGRLREYNEFRLITDGANPPVIYMIKQKTTGKCYVGQTTQPFTLRWWQHLSSSGDCKFHTALRSSKITDWEFSVLEVIEYPEDCESRVGYITEREGFWIGKLNSVDDGLNTITPAQAMLSEKVV